jgi:hypothetical protein
MNRLDEQDISEVEDDEDDELLLSPESARKVREQEEREIRAASRGVSSPLRRTPSAVAVASAASARRLGKRRAVEVPVKRPIAAPNEVNESAPEPTQGRFDDAPEDHTPVGPIKRRAIGRSTPTAEQPGHSTSRPTRSSQRLARGRADEQDELAMPATTAAEGDAMGHVDAPPHSPLSLPSGSPRRTSQQRRVLGMLEEAARARAAVESMDYDGLMALIGHVNELRDAATANLKARVERERVGKGKGRKRGREEEI